MIDRIFEREGPNPYNSKAEGPNLFYFFGLYSVPVPVELTLYSDPADSTGYIEEDKLEYICNSARLG